MRIIVAQPVLAPNRTRKPKDFLGTDEDWAVLEELGEQDAPPEAVPVEPVPPREEAEPVPVKQPEQVLPQPETQEPVPVEQPEQPEQPEPVAVPEWLGTEVPQEETLPIDEPEEDTTEVPTAISPHEPPSEYQEYLEDQNIQKVVPKEDVEPVDPAQMFKEVLPANTPLEERNAQMDIRQKIWYSMYSGDKLKINYDTLVKAKKPSVNVTRLVLPQYVAFHNGTNQFFLYTKPDPLRRGEYGPVDPSNADGWKSFAIDNIRSATLEE